ncbi:MAG: CvpA family protein [Alphaproteobacteria bacterium]|nr:CvpA family protein [Alphaproteobacteria bacterium]
MNNLDIFILVVVAISALIALNRGLLKEVLSIIGWSLSVVAIVVMLPVVEPFMHKYIDNDIFAVIVSSILIIVIFFVIWIIITSQIISKIRASKLSAIDRILGLFFGIVRACILVILFNILAGWMLPPDEQPDLFKESKYYQLAGDFAEPIEKMLPQELFDSVKEQQEEKEEEKNEEESVLSEDMNNLFDKLLQPKVEKKKIGEEEEKSSEGYNKSEQNSLDRLIELSIE